MEYTIHNLKVDQVRRMIHAHTDALDDRKKALRLAWNRAAKMEEFSDSQLIEAFEPFLEDTE